MLYHILEKLTENGSGIAQPLPKRKGKEKYEICYNPDHRNYSSISDIWSRGIPIGTIHPYNWTEYGSHVVIRLSEKPQAYKIRKMFKDKSDDILILI